MKLYTIFAVLLYVTYNHGLKLPEVDFESLSEKIVSYVNSRPEIGWKAERSKSLNVKNIARHFNERRKVRRRADITNLNTVSYQNLHIDLPETFDARENWPACSSIRNIPDEGRCDAAWAISPAATISDRICIHSNGSINVEISAFDILTCNHHCSRGCDGCDPEEAWKQWMESGVTTGGSFQSRRGCKPYPFPKCDHVYKRNYPTCEGEYSRVSACEEKCQESYNVSYVDDLHYGSKIYFVEADEESIRKEIFLNGPVQAEIYASVDFLFYKSGIYKRVSTELFRVIDVRILGWGVEDNTPYWLCANVWNEDWGENGFFRILRGYDESSIEDWVISGIPAFNVQESSSEHILQQ
ncbi:unnamed protein product [Heterobilharzia americana]|nr:unnamed protein product [Heterobilharzia americana]CAH8431511.1 unnamed protein product [Heterobilharzia americana]